MDIRIHQQYGLIGLRTYPSQLSIKQPPAQMTAEREKGSLSIETHPARVLMDQTQCFAEAGLKTIFMLNRDFAEKSREDAIEAIGEIAVEGSRLLEFQTGENAIAELAKEKGQNQYDTNIVFMPHTPPDIRVEPGSLNIHYTPDKLRIRWDIHIPPEINATRPRVEVYMVQQPGIEIEYVGKTLDEYV